MKHPALRVPPGGNQVDGLPPAAIGLPGDYRTIRKIWVVFLKNVKKFYIKPIFWEFVLLKLVNVKAHARGFAPL